MKTNDLLEKLVDDQSGIPSYFKDMMLRDLAELEGKLEHFRVMYGVDITLDAHPVQAEEGRWLGKGIVDKIIANEKNDFLSTVYDNLWKQYS